MINLSRFNRIRNSGFTLLEVMLVLVILSVLMVSSSQSIQQAIKSKIKIQNSTDEMSKVRDAIKIMEKDINLAFHYRDVEKEMQEAIQKSYNSAGSPATPPPNPGSAPPAPPPAASNLFPPNPKRVDPVTHFVGKENEMYFATLNSGRILSSIKQADFIKVAYLIQPCRKPGSESATVDCLVRRYSPIVEGDITKDGKDIVLLEDIREFKLRYFGFGKQDWNSSWSSIYNDGGAKDKYPDAVEISLTVGSRDDKSGKKKISMQIVASIHQPNNK